MKKKWLFFPSLVVIMILLASNSSNNCNDVHKVSTNNYHYNLHTATTCNNNWRDSNHQSENYNFCWVFTDGSYARSLAYPAPQGSSAPFTDISVNTALNSGPLTFTGVANRKGDDLDKKVIAGGSDGNPGGTPLDYRNYPLAQRELTGPRITRIQTDFNSDLIANTDEVLLIITINNDTIKGTDSVFQLMKPGYNLSLYHSNNNISYNHYNYHGVGQNGFPSNDEQYFEFAAHAQPTHYPPGYGSLFALSQWKIVNTFKGHEKNVYCVLHFTTPPPATDEALLLDTFTVVLSDTSGNYQPVAGSRYDFPYMIGASHDPNIIEVNHPVSTTCAKDEELEYTIHFQNTGISSAHTVKVNLELDPVLDPTTFKVWESGIGTQYILGAANATTALSPSASFSSNPNSNFSFSVNPQRTTTPPAVGNDITFNFTNVDLAGVNASNMQDSKGYIRFTIKTLRPFTAIHNRAGIVFDTNDEIVTNLAVTTCRKSTDSIAAQLAACQATLEDCEKGHEPNGMMDWLPWAIAGLEALIIVYLLASKRK